MIDAEFSCVGYRDLWRRLDGVDGVRRLYVADDGVGGVRRLLIGRRSR
jgi:hypothetical protein